MEHIDKDTFKQIFRDPWDEFKAFNPRYNTAYFDEVIQKMLNCGDSEKTGFAQYRCFNYGEERRIAFSCKSPFCLSCAKPHTEQWMDFISRRLLPGRQHALQPSDAAHNGEQYQLHERVELPFADIRVKLLEQLPRTDFPNVSEQFAEKGPGVHGVDTIQRARLVKLEGHLAIISCRGLPTAKLRHAFVEIISVLRLAKHVKCYRQYSEAEQAS